MLSLLCSNHHLEHKRLVVRTLFHRAQTVITEDQDKETEMKHLSSVLQNNNYKPWIFKTPLGTTHKPKGTAKKGSSSVSVHLSYLQGVSEQLTQVFRKQEVGTYHKPVNTIRQRLVHSKDPTPMEKKCGVVYKIQCRDCEEVYIGFREHVNSTRASMTAVAHAQSFLLFNCCKRRRHLQKKNTRASMTAVAHAQSFLLFNCKRRRHLQKKN